MHRHWRDDSGTSLIELLIASAIIGASVVSLLGALGTGVSLSSANAAQSEGEAALRSVIEQVRNAAFVPCASTSTYDVTLEPSAVDSGLSATVEQVRYYDVATDVFVGTCPAPSADLVQLISVRVTTDDHRVGGQVIDVAKRAG